MTNKLVASVRLFLCAAIASSLHAAPIHTAASAGDLSKIEQILTDGADVNAPHEVSGLTPWQIARMHGREEAAELLAKKGADTNREFPKPGEIVDRALKNAVKEDSPGFAVLVARDGKVVYERGFGMEDIEAKKSITPETAFRIGSVTKQFTAAAILLSEEDGKLKVTDTIDKYYPGFPRGDKITLHHLLTHTSGIYNFTALPGFMKQATEPVTPAQVIASFRDVSPNFAPGASHMYCNSGYYLLGDIVEKVQGRSYVALLKDRVFDKEGMKTTGAHRPGLGLAHEAKGYAPKEEKDKNAGWKLALNWHMSQAGGAGELYSTVGDLYRWNEAVFNGRVLSAESQKKALTPLKEQADAPKKTDAFDGNYAYGWVVAEVRGLKSIWHNGGLNGFTSELRRFPDQKVTVVVFSNSASPIGGFSAAGVAELAARQFLWREMKPQPSFREQELAEGTKLEDYVGTFDFSGLGVMRFRVERGRLQAKLADQKWGDVGPADRDVFREPSVDANFAFKRDEKGAVTSVTLKQRGTVLSGNRFAEPQEGEMTRAALDELTGKYQLGIQTFEVKLSPRGSYLLARLGEQPDFAYYPVAEKKDRVFCKAIRVELEFKREKDGKIQGLVLHQGGMMMPFARVEQQASLKK
ncbi:CubicO group peptidase (beta-lactamase class C family) [Roseimicrobium gellanilyticum]|uniref:CubicO group peptidase (Beta-lactamase class C family) n=1 Tax=Roseimicrobium gellanilyticum TaxID=748857 RepID=A0A366HAA8_9BACT|nr:serine hydrolase [Roseimicrobium gellanilyticum]RBP39145.1 CubicO group peptidase (beta-lactamase class C family) [Roseimicrobium gellanilyticum]